MEFVKKYCTLCGPNAPSRVKYPANLPKEGLATNRFSARRIDTGVHCRLVKCKQCGLIYSNPTLDNASLSKIYQEAELVFEDLEQQIYESYVPVLDKALHPRHPKGTFVEIGGSSGYMLRYAVEKGFQRQIEIEPSQEAESQFRPPSPTAEFIRDTFSRGILAKDSVSLICFFQMLDHVPDPRDFLETAWETLQPGGTAVCVVHNTAAMSAKILGEKSPIYSLQHIYLFNRKNLTRLFSDVGFDEVQGFPIRNHYALDYWLYGLPLPTKIKGTLRKGLKIARLSERRLKFYAGNLAVIGRKPFKTTS